MAGKGKEEERGRWNMVDPWDKEWMGKAEYG